MSSGGTCAISRRPVKQSYTVGYNPDTKRTHLVSNNTAFQKAIPNVHVKLHDWSNEEIAVGLRDGRLKVA